MITGRTTKVEDLILEGLSEDQIERILRHEAQLVDDHTVYGADVTQYLLTTLKGSYYDLQGVLTDMAHLGMGDEVCVRTLRRVSAHLSQMHDAITKYQT